MPDQTAPDAWIDGHPQLEAIAAAVWEQCGRSDSGTCVEDDPRNIAVAALAALLAPAARRDLKAVMGPADGQQKMRLLADFHANATPIPAPADRAALAEDLRYVLNYRGPGHAHDRPGVWDTSGKPCEHCARLAVAQSNLAAYDADPDAALPVLPTSADRVAILREAADVLDTLPAGATSFDKAEHKYKGGGAAETLRRMADEAQQPETPDVVAVIVAALQKRAGELSGLAEEQMRPSLEERAQEWHEAVDVARRAAKAAAVVPAKKAPTPFVPPTHYRSDHGDDYCVHANLVGPDSCPACRELHDDEQPAVGAQQPKEA